MTEKRKLTPQERWEAKNVTRVQLKIIKTTEADILEKLNSVPNKNGYIKALIRADIAANGGQKQSEAKTEI